MMKSNQSQDEKQSRMNVVKSPLTIAGTTQNRYSYYTYGTSKLYQFRKPNDDLRSYKIRSFKFIEHFIF